MNIIVSAPRALTLLGNCFILCPPSIFSKKKKHPAKTAFTRSLSLHPSSSSRRAVSACQELNYCEPHVYRFLVKASALLCIYSKGSPEVISTFKTALWMALLLTLSRIKSLLRRWESWIKNIQHFLQKKHDRCNRRICVLRNHYLSLLKNFPDVYR